MNVKKIIKKLVIDFLISVLLTLLTVALLKDSMFFHRNTEVITDWSQYEYGGYLIEGQKVISNAGDPYIYFYSEDAVYRVDVDVQMVSNVELLWNKDFYGEEVIYAELFWTDESGNLTEENSIPFKIKAGRYTYSLDVDCPANTLYRLDIGDGEGVEFNTFSFTFYTRKEYTKKEKVISVLVMMALSFAVLITFEISNLLKKDNHR